VKRAQLDVQILVLVTLALVAFGLVMVYSATSASATISNGDPNSYLKRQGIYAAIGLVLLFVFSRISFRSLRKLAHAGLSRTTSPGCASSRACATARSSVSS